MLMGHGHESACLSKLSDGSQATDFKDVKSFYPILGKFKNRSIKKHSKYDDTTLTRVFKMAKKVKCREINIKK